MVACSFAITAQADGNASNPLAAVSNTDIRYQYIDLGSNTSSSDAFIDGAVMLNPDLKLKYEAHYISTDVSGSRQNAFQKLNLKGIYFPSQKQLNETWGIKTAIGLEWILDFGNPTDGTGTGSDQLAPLAGVAFANSKTGLTLIPLVQHFTSYNGSTDVNQTAMRLIALQPFAEGYWAKADLKLPYDWEGEAWPVSAELQIGKNISSSLAIYGDFLVGIGGDRSFEKGVGLGIRFNY